jgi:hypothetical protein
MKNLVAFPLLALVIMLQMAIVSRISLLSGTADLMLLVLVAWALQDRIESAWHWAILGGAMTAFASGLPFFVPLLGYIAVVALARFVKSLVWQTPVLALLSVTFFATMFMQIFTFVVLWFNGVPLALDDVVAFIMLPSVFLNLLLALPIHAFIRDLALWVSPVEEMV